MIEVRIDRIRDGDTKLAANLIVTQFVIPPRDWRAGASSYAPREEVVGQDRDDVAEASQRAAQLQLALGAGAVAERATASSSVGAAERLGVGAADRDQVGEQLARRHPPAELGLDQLASMPSRAARKRFSASTSCGIERSMWSCASSTSARTIDCTRAAIAADSASWSARP